MTRFATPKLRVYTTGAAVALIAALIFGRPELAAVAAPFVAIVAAGFASVQEPEYTLRIWVDHETAVEGERVEVRIAVDCVRSAWRADVRVTLPAGLKGDPSDTVALFLGPGRSGQVSMPVLCHRWGVHLIGEAIVVASDRLGLFRFEAHFPARVPVKVYPRSETLRTLPQPTRTLPFFGNLVSRDRGEGIELAEVRPFVNGDRVRSINWRATARRGDVWVTDRHPERNADVVIFLDAFTDLSSGDRSTLEVAVRAAASLAGALLDARHRVGLVSFGGVLRWLLPGTGRRQLYRTIDALFDTQIMLSYAWKDVDVIPRRTLPPRALVVAVSPLLDERTVEALFDLRGRGFDLAVLEISSEPFIRQPEGETEQLAFRVWRLQRDALRHRFQRLGVAVSALPGEAELGRAMEEVEAFRRHAPPVRL